ncbi:PQQ-binding-like beta-propeller repeat protein [Nocardiopsis sp. JB363]|uniref:outer membrane protein assembly factor BamB family protein n=1 Tax=Nocardiopsis sp. JB363 TaxID=1434837 RepID=UPI001F335B9B|nr:PQQ-binding-like beta-propeller repeat protein [Nocardiopsis sp. JB363]
MRNRRNLAVSAVCLAMTMSACSSSQEEGPGPQPSADHNVAEDEISAPDAVSSVSGIGWEWRPGEGERVTAVHPGPVGAVIELADGLVGLRGDTGDELWRYRVPDTEGFSASFSPSGTNVLVTATDEPSALLDTATGASLAEDVEGGGGARLLDEGRLLHQRGEATETLLEVSDLETGETLWSQGTPQTCSDGGPTRQISTSHHSDAIVLLLHCSEDTSEGALRTPAPDTVNALVALDPVEGRELWRVESEDTDGLGMAQARMFQDGLVAEFPGEEGWLIIDPTDGTTIAESPKPVLSIHEDGYLAGPDPFAEDPTHELRTFDGEVTATVTVPDGRLPADTPESAVGLPEHLLGIDMERGTPEDAIDVLLTPWVDEGSGEVIDATTTETASNLDPGRLLPVAGAVLVYVPVERSAGIDTVEHVVALQ